MCNTLHFESILPDTVYDKWLIKLKVTLKDPAMKLTISKTDKHPFRLSFVQTEIFLFPLSCVDGHPPPAHPVVKNISSLAC